MKIIFRCLIAIGILLLVLWIAYTIKPAWFEQVKGLFAHRTKAKATMNKRIPVTSRDVTRSNREPPPVVKKPEIKEEKRVIRTPTPEPQSREVAPKKLERPRGAIPPISLPSKTDKKFDDYMEIGVLYAQKGNYQKAEELFKEVLKEDSLSSTAHNNLGFVYLKQGKHELAERHFREAMKIDPAFVLPYYNLACLYSRKGMDVEALIYLKKALKRDQRVKLWAVGDEDFERLRSDIVFQELVGSSSPKNEGTKGVSR